VCLVSPGYARAWPSHNRLDLRISRPNVPYESCFLRLGDSFFFTTQLRIRDSPLATEIFAAVFFSLPHARTYSFSAPLSTSASSVLFFAILPFASDLHFQLRLGL